MEKKIWSKPEMNEFAFAANEYVAACGDGRKYEFECNAPGGTLYYYNDLRVTENNPVPSDWDQHSASKPWLFYGEYDPCNKEHEAPVTDEFYWGYIDYDHDQVHDYQSENGGSVVETVIVWLERSWLGIIKNYHATKELNMSSWTTSKS